MAAPIQPMTYKFVWNENAEVLAKKAVDPLRPDDYIVRCKEDQIIIEKNNFWTNVKKIFYNLFSDQYKFDKTLAKIDTIGLKTFFKNPQNVAEENLLNFYSIKVFDYCYKNKQFNLDSMKETAALIEQIQERAAKLSPAAQGKAQAGPSIQSAQQPTIISPVPQQPIIINLVTQQPVPQPPVSPATQQPASLVTQKPVASLNLVPQKPVSLVTQKPVASLNLVPQKPVSPATQQPASLVTQKPVASLNLVTQQSVPQPPVASLNLVPQSSVSSLVGPSIAKPKAEGAIPVGNGIAWYGNSCYLEATMQALRYSASFRKYVQQLAEFGDVSDDVFLIACKDRTSQDPKKRDRAAFIIQRRIASRFTHFFYVVETKKEVFPDVHAFRLDLIRAGFDVRQYSQEDASQAAGFILEALHFPPFTYKVSVQSKLEGTYDVWERQYTEPVLTLPLGEKTRNVQGLLSRAKIREEIDAPNRFHPSKVGASHPKGPFETTKTTHIIGAPPPLLVINLSRYAARKTGQDILFQSLDGTSKSVPEVTMKKIKDQIIIPETIKVPTDKPNVVLNYRLQSVVIHSGATLHGGHYYNYCPRRQEKGPTQWVEYNDENVIVRGDLQSIKKNLYRNGYELYYELIEEEPKPKNPPAQVNPDASKT